MVARTSTTLRIAQIVPATEAEGPGRRFAIWFQGCSLRCPECCNPEMLSFEGGQAISVDSLLDDICQGRDASQIEGVTMLGGEPFAHAAGAAELAAGVQCAGLSVMVFSGFTLAELHAMNDPAVRELLENTDILVDGPYLRERPEHRRCWIGSANQQIHFLTDRYRPDDPRWLRPNTLEIRLIGGELAINGFPATGAKDFWQRLPRHAARGEQP